ncbi:MAG: hypothetical protein FWE14_13010 [Lachnospiraceae bacterium]|nr:hypothetical protein [Lachnospiraceae bacterium]
MIELQILTDGLAKKKGILSQIEAENINQENTLKTEPVSFDDFEAIVDRKTVLIDELNKLDQGFESVYDRIKDSLLANKVRFKAEIEGFKILISEITELSVSIQAQEARNKTLVEKFFKKSREDIQAERIRAKSSYDFMNRMANQDVAPRFLDTKK